MTFCQCFFLRNTKSDQTISTKSSTKFKGRRQIEPFGPGTEQKSFPFFAEHKIPAKLKGPPFSFFSGF